jgi:peptidyl-prolyl cis-trans isomerase SurA
MKRLFFSVSVIITGIVLAAPFIFAEQEPIESIVAIVGREPIMASELAAQIQMVAIQQGLRPETQEEIDRLKADILDQMISERLFLIQARKDTSIKVIPEEIEQAENEQIARIASQFDSEEAFLEQLSREGLTLRSFKKRLRPDIENQLLKQRLINQKLSRISISKQEVLEFYDKYKDSIPPQPEAVRLAHILITFQPSQTTEDSVRQAAEEIRQNAAAGADFATLAATYSEGPTALTGGDLGFISSDDVVPEFGRVAFNLSPGDISGPVRTQYGYHIIKCEEVQGRRARFRHILFEVNPTAQDSALSYLLVDSLTREIENGADFKELAKVYSADNDSRKQGGELGWFAIENLPPTFIEALDSMVNIDDIHSPVPSEFGLHILKKLDWQEGRVLTPETDFDKIRDMARQSKTGEFVDKWLKEIRENTYVEIRPVK